MYHPGYMNPYTRSGMFRRIMMNIYAGNEGSCVLKKHKTTKNRNKTFSSKVQREKNVEVVKEEDTTTGRRIRT